LLKTFAKALAYRNESRTFTFVAYSKSKLELKVKLEQTFVSNYKFICCSVLT